MCRLCYLFHSDTRYRDLWGGGPLPGVRSACALRGAEVGRELCPTCKGKVLVKTFACEAHGRCTVARRLPGVACCVGCGDFRPLAITKRNLLFFLMPQAGNDVWREHVRTLKAHAGLFNGSRRVGIVTGDGFDPPGAVQEEFGKDWCDYFVAPNDPGLREVVHFDRLFGSIASTDPEEATFFAQGKGIRYPWAFAVREWVRIMYASCLDYWPLVEERLHTHAFAGSFLKRGRFFGNKSPSTWHYSGTFFWLRHAAVFSRPWRHVERHMYGMESWPGVVVPPSQAACLFWDRHTSPLELYDEPIMRHIVAPAFAEWEKEHAGQRQEVWA